MPPPGQVVDLRNAEIPRNGILLAGRMSISPFALRSMTAGLTLWHLELLARTEFEREKFLKSEMLRREEASLKIQLLKRAGDIYKTSLAFGVVGYWTEKTWKSLWAARPRYSIFVAGDVALPDMLSSYGSAYVDARKASGGINVFPFHDHFRDAVSIILQLDYVWNRNWRDRFRDPLVLQGGVRFRASETFSTSFAYEENEFLVFAVEVVL